jgi:hypothetical protein
MNRKLAGAMLAAALLASIPASAHHSFAMFDHTREVELKDATVVKWEWTNPHTWLYLVVPNGTPIPDNYAIEGNNPGVLRRQGFSIGTFKPGDKVTVYIWPLLSGDKGGAMTVAVLAGGKVLGEHLQKVQ